MLQEKQRCRIAEPRAPTRQCSVSDIPHHRGSGCSERAIERTAPRGESRGDTFLDVCACVSDSATWHYGRPSADSVALRDVWAPTTIDSKAQRRRTAGGVPLPLVRARATARKYSTTFVCTDVFYCKEAMLQRCQQILCQRISPNTACFCAPSPNILTTRPHFFFRANTLPMACFLLSTA